MDKYVHLVHVRGKKVEKHLSKRSLLWISTFCVLKCFEAALDDSVRERSETQIDPDLFEKRRYFKSSEIVQWFHVRNRLKLKPLLTEDLDIGSRFVHEMSNKWTNNFESVCFPRKAIVGQYYFYTITELIIFWISLVTF